MCYEDIARGKGWEKAYMTRWLMEMGAGKPVDEYGVINNQWYGDETVSATHPSIREYFDIFRPPNDATINQKGLDFIKGGQDV